MDLRHVVLFLALAWTALAAVTPDCKNNKLGFDSFVCVCSASSPCDKIANPDKGQVNQYETSRDGARLKKSHVTAFATPPRNASIVPIADGVLHITVTNTKRQEILGFGGAFTDTATGNIVKVGDALGNQILHDYFSADGIEYNIGRITIGGSDFSPVAYSLDDGAADLSLSHFNLSAEDTTHKIPVIKRAKALATHDIRLYGSPWSAPAWMKSNNKLTNGGSIKGDVGSEYWQAWAKYFVRYLNAYAQQGIQHWGITIQNEPYASQGFNSMYYTPAMMRDFLAKTLGPELERGGYSADKLKVMIWDHNLDSVVDWVRTIFADPTASKYAAGTAVHWYANTPNSILDQPHNLHPDKFILATEACDGPGVRLGNWRIAEHYASDIIGDLLHWTIGWTDWNMVLDTRGGPTWINNFVDAPIIIDPAANVYYRQPHFYAMGHFSKFIKPGAVRVDTTNVASSGNKALVAAFRNPDSTTAIVIVNNDDASFQFTADDGGKSFTAHVNPHSFKTFVY